MAELNPRLVPCRNEVSWQGCVCQKVKKNNHNSKEMNSVAVPFFFRLSELQVGANSAAEQMGSELLESVELCALVTGSVVRGWQ